MSKAFDSINRHKLMSYLSEILTQSEVYMMIILINDVIINVVMGNEIGIDILTNIGSCQGDLRSLLYLYNKRRNSPTTGHT